MKTLGQIKTIDAMNRRKDKQDFIAVLFCVAASCGIVLWLVLAPTL